MVKERVGHNYTGHDYIGHSCIGHNYIGHNYTGHKKNRWKMVKERVGEKLPSSRSLDTRSVLMEVLQKTTGLC